jgi:N-acetylmuramoyl-L-alanine amidase
VLKTAAMPAILVEGGFMSNPVEGPKIGQSAYRKKIAAGIVAGITDYKKVVER